MIWKNLEALTKSLRAKKMQMIKEVELQRLELNNYYYKIRVTKTRSWNKVELAFQYSTLALL